MAYIDDVRSSLYRHDCGVGEIVGDGLHLHAIGGHDAFEAEPFPEQALYDGLGERRGQVLGLHGGESHMGRHDGTDFLRDEPFEGHKLDRLEPFHTVRNDWESEVRIHGRVPMPGEMLGRREDAGLGEAAGKGRREVGD